MYKVESDDEKPKEMYTEIGHLNHYDRKFVVRGRIIKKQELKHFAKKDSGQGSVFSIVIADESRDIQCTFFNQAAEQFYPVLVEGESYSFSGAEIRTAGKFNTTRNKLELHFDSNATIKRVHEDFAVNMSVAPYVTLSDVQGKQEKEVVSIIAILDSIGPLRSVNVKNN